MGCILGQPRIGGWHRQRSRLELARGRSRQHRGAGRDFVCVLRHFSIRGLTKEFARSTVGSGRRGSPAELLRANRRQFGCGQLHRSRPDVLHHGGGRLPAPAVAEPGRAFGGRIWPCSGARSFAALKRVVRRRTPPHPESGRSCRREEGAQIGTRPRREVCPPRREVCPPRRPAKSFSSKVDCRFAA